MGARAYRLSWAIFLTLLSALSAPEARSQEGIDSKLARIDELKRELAKVRREMRLNRELWEESNNTADEVTAPARGLIPKIPLIGGKLAKVIETRSPDEVQASLDAHLERLSSRKKEIEDEIARIELTLQVTYFWLDGNTLNSALRTVQDLSCGQRSALDSSVRPIYFQDDRTFETWASKFGGLEDKIAYYSKRDPYLIRCLASPEITDGIPVQVGKRVDEECVRSDGKKHVISNRVKYSVQRRRGEIEVSTFIRFRHEGDAANRALVQERIKALSTCARDFFARHGIRLVLAYELERGPKTTREPEKGALEKGLEKLIDRLSKQTDPIVVRAHDRMRGPNVESWPILQRIWKHEEVEDLTEERLCSLAIHEIGHNLGLLDTYASEDCANREARENDDVMSKGGMEDPHLLRLYPEDLKKIIAPLCRGKA